MALVTRISRLFKADFHAVLDQIEEPGQLLRQAIRDMQDEIAIAEQRLSNRVAEQRSLEARCADVRLALADLDEQLDLCFRSGKEDLARSLIRKKLETGRILKQFVSRIEANQRHLAEQSRVIEENRTTLEGLRQKAEVFAHRNTIGQGDPVSTDGAWFARELSVGDDEVEVAFLQEKARRSES